MTGTTAVSNNNYYCGYYYCYYYYYYYYYYYIIIICFIIIKITIKVTFLCLNCSHRVVNYSSTMYATPLTAIEKNLSTLDFVTSPSLFYQLEILFPIGLVLDFEHLLLILVELINALMKNLMLSYY